MAVSTSSTYGAGGTVTERQAFAAPKRVVHSEGEWSNGVAECESDGVHRAGRGATSRLQTRRDLPSTS